MNPDYITLYFTLWKERSTQCEGILHFSHSYKSRKYILQILLSNSWEFSVPYALPV